MKNLIIALIILTSHNLSAQKIDYSFPEGYENEMSKKDYKYLVNESVKAVSAHYKIASIEQFYNQHPQPISTDFYWYYEGQFTRMNVLDNQGEITVIAPIGLAELMTEKK